MTNFFDTQPSATTDEINSLEQYASLSFPDDYRSHLLHYNGGQCLPNGFSFLENGKVSSSNVDWFLATRSEEWGSLKDYIETFKVDEKRMPSNLLPIAFDPGGNLICISCSGLDLGRIYFWDHENEVDYSIADDEDYSNIYLVSNHLTQFLDSLREDED